MLGQARRHQRLPIMISVRPLIASGPKRQRASLRSPGQKATVAATLVLDDPKADVICAEIAFLELSCGGAVAGAVVGRAKE